MCQTDFCIIQSFCSPLAHCHCQTWGDKSEEMLILNLLSSSLFPYPAVQQSIHESASMSLCWGLCQPLLFLTALFLQGNLPPAPLEGGLVWRRSGPIHFHLFWAEIHGCSCACGRKGVNTWAKQSIRHGHHWVLQVWEGSRDWCPFPSLPCQPLLAQTQMQLCWFLPVNLK